MKRLALLCALFCLASPQAANAAKCSGGANCTACKSCAACANCSKRGGTCSVCRPDLYRSGAAATKAKPPAKAASTPITAPTSFSARCVGVTDGDTLRVLYVSGQTKSPIKIRLYGIDAPEKSQAFGTQSKKKLSDLAFGKDLTIYSKGTDRYGRLLAWLFVGSTPINAEMVKSGLAWHYRKYAPKEKKLADLETAARKNRRGLWIDAAPVAPWDYRKKK